MSEGSSLAAMRARLPRFVRVIQLSCAGQGEKEEESDTVSNDNSGSPVTGQPGGEQGGGPVSGGRQRGGGR